MPTTALFTNKAALPGSPFPGDFLLYAAETPGWQIPRVTEGAYTIADVSRPFSTLREVAKVASTSLRAALPLEVNADSTPIQIWEGTVISIDQESKVMQVFLDAKMGAIPRHTGEISLEWVSEQDQDLVQPGAVFYLTLFKRTMRGSVQNSQELRFRRRPSWTAAQLHEFQRAAGAALANMSALPTAE